VVLPYRPVGERQDANNAGRGSGRVTISEAATLLDVHPNTVRNRIRSGMYSAEKVVTERGPTWMIDRDSLIANALPSDSQQLVGRVPQEALTALAREIVREAGLVRDLEAEAVEKRREQFIEGGREYYKALVTYSKDMATLSGATLVGVTVVTRAFIPNPEPVWLIYAACVLLFFATMFSSLDMYLATFQLRRFSTLDAPTDLGELEEIQKRRRSVVGSAFGRATIRQRLRDWEASLANLLYYVGLGLFLWVFLNAVD
jgi:hypothetical protein